MSLIRSLDSQRRLTLPKEALRAVSIEHGDLLAVYSSKTPDGKPCVIVEKFEKGCCICGASGRVANLRPVKGKEVCYGCRTTLGCPQ